MLPIDGNRGADPQATLASFNPSPELVEWAAKEHGIKALPDDDVLGKFVDYQRASGRRPRDLDAAYRNWIRAEAKFTSPDQSRRPTPGRRKRAFRETALAQIGRWGT